MKFSVVFGFLILTLSSLHARTIGLQAGIGSWYGDALHTSIQYGGGFLARPGVDWIEFAISFDRAPVQLKSIDTLAPQLQNKTLTFWRFGTTFPMPLEIHKLKAELFPLISYVLTDHADQTSHGFGVGGGLEFYFLDGLLGARFEALEQFYKIPTDLGSTSLQEDFFFGIKATLNY